VCGSLFTACRYRGFVATVIELVCYPIKGCAGVPMAEAVLTPAGLAHDRSFMVIGEDGVFRSQRHDPRLAVIRAGVSADGQWLTLGTPGADDVRIEVDLTGARRDVEMFGRPYPGIDQGDAVAGWLSEVLGAASRLVRTPPEYKRMTDGLTPGTAGFADGHALLVTSLSSLDLLNGRMLERGGEPLPMDRFRANVVITGWPDPYTEDRARQMSIGETELGYAKLALRCAVTTVDQKSGKKTGPEPLRTLADYRRVQGGVAFGAKFSVIRPGWLAVGDEVNVGSWGEPDL
jgi:uncharacterized protein YcbX